MKPNQGRSVGTAATLIIFCIFAMSVLTVLLLGASAYRNITVISKVGYEERACLSYVWTKVKNNDEGLNIYAGDFQGLSALYIDEDFGWVTYHTIIYHYDGWLYEMYTEKGITFEPKHGTRIARTESLSFERTENGLIKATAGSESMFIAPRGEGGRVN